ncbi:ABC transporter permease [Mucilaginibacter pallidiroseus]|uniref:ABC transporter permease n=1 Tax=Mucilaginibacter pallidiroseus TaxID=2599295 RepID=A0A563UF60_9SPHI|nr:FtsX-like permease family protein [Mucilaginibacter pallidiroseus]TWR30010.1 ABC transporter permease [Mucilaginibacter pallidiroseus]
MNTAIYIAKRYLFSKKQTHAINIISGISMLGVLVGSAALIIILSVFNGFEQVILSLYSNFTPQIKIEPAQGKRFDPNALHFHELSHDKRVLSYTQVLQEKVLIRYGDRPFIGTIMGVSDGFLKNTHLDSTITWGSFTLKEKGRYYAVIGSTIQGSLGVNIKSEELPLQVYSPRRTAGNSNDPMNDFVFRSIFPSGVFAIQQDFDNIIITPIEFTRDLLGEPLEVSAIEINYKPGNDVDKIREEVQETIGDKYVVKNRREQNTELYKTINYERWSIFMILVFVLIIAIFNIIGSLTMLVMDKRKDIAILTSLGANKRLIQGIFFFEGMMISAIGCVAGIVIGYIVCFIQKEFSLIKMGAKLSVLDAYPVEYDFVNNIALVIFTVGLISVIASGISSRLSIKGLDDIKQEL